MHPRPPAVEDEAQRSALGELLGCDCETMGRNALQRASDRLLRHRDTIETRLFQRAADLFDLQPTVTLHDRTSTCFEGAADRQPLEGSGATHPGVHGLRTNSVGWDAERLDVDASPGGVRKLVVQPRRRRENARNAVPHA